MEFKKINLYSYLFNIFFISNIVLWPIKFQSQLNIRFNIIIVIMIALVLVCKNFISNRTFKNTIFIGAILLIHELIVFFVGSDHVNSKSILSIPVIITLVFVASELGVRSKPKDWLGLEKVSILVLVIVFLSILCEIIFPEFFPKTAVYRIGGIFSGIYDEPSHLGFSIIPCLLILTISNNKLTVATGIFFSILFLYLSPSSTLKVLITISTFVVFIKKTSFIKLTTIFLLLILLTFQIDSLEKKINDVLIKTTDIVYESGNNLSSLVYKQGLSDAITNFRETFGLGVGLNMMGVKINENEFRKKINLIGLEGLNNEDGSFLASKGISELGILFIYFYLLLVFIFFKTYIKDIKNYKRDENHIKALIIFAFLLTSILRSSGYFCGTLSLALLAFFSQNRLFSYK